MNEDIRIEPLRGPERVRRRAAVIFGDDGLEGVCEQVNLLLDIFLPQVKSGFCKHLIVKRDATEVLTLEGDDMGLYLCDPLAPSDEIWQTLFCQMQVLPRGEDYAYGLTKRQDLFQPPQGSLEDYIWYQLNLYSAQCASEFFSVRVRRDGYEYKLHFEKGEPESSLEVTPCDAPSGTCFTFRPDNTVFRDICLSAEQLAAFGRLLSLDNPGLAVSVVDEKLGLAQDFCCPNGILDALDVDTPVYTAAGYAKGRERYDREEYEANVHLALTFCTEGGAECIHNGRWLPDGGIHLVFRPHARLPCHIQERARHHSGLCRADPQQKAAA